MPLGPEQKLNFWLSNCQDNCFPIWVTADTAQFVVKWHKLDIDQQTAPLSRPIPGLAPKPVWMPTCPDTIAVHNIPNGMHQSGAWEMAAHRITIHGDGSPACANVVLRHGMHKEACHSHQNYSPQLGLDRAGISASRWAKRVQGLGSLQNT